MKPILILMMIVRLGFNYQLHECIEYQQYIEENGLELVTLSCYTDTGSKNASGLWPTEGTCACNREHLGQDVIIFDENLLPVDRLHCQDTGGNKLLREGRAIDVYRSSYQRCVEYKGKRKKVYIMWVDHDFQGEIEPPRYVGQVETD